MKSQIPAFESLKRFKGTFTIDFLLNQIDPRKLLNFIPTIMASIRNASIIKLKILLETEPFSKQDLKQPLNQYSIEFIDEPYEHQFLKTLKEHANNLSIRYPKGKDLIFFDRDLVKKLNQIKREFAQCIEYIKDSNCKEGLIKVTTKYGKAYNKQQ
eukprot:403370213